MVDYVDAGLSANSVSYSTALERQRALHADVSSGRAPDTVLLLEHPSVYTAGKRTEPHERPTDGTPVIDVDRGGKITWHGPGQLVGYPIHAAVADAGALGPLITKLRHTNITDAH